MIGMSFSSQAQLLTLIIADLHIGEYKYVIFFGNIFPLS